MTPTHSDSHSTGANDDRARRDAARQARIRLSSDGVVASYIREISGHPPTLNASVRSGGAQR
jgi:hypothetical protein